MITEVRTRHVPLRRCVMCRTVAPRAQLLRLTQGDDGYRLDLARRSGGRGTWVCSGCATNPDEKRLRQAFKGQAQAVRALLAAAHSHSSPAAQGAAGNPASEA